MNTSTIPACLETLRDLLAARAGLTGVQIATGPLGSDTEAESIQFVDVRVEQRDAAIGRQRRHETYTVLGGLWVAKYGAGETVIVEARERAFALLAEIEAQLVETPNLDGVVHRASLQRFTVEQGVNDAGRWTQISFEIAVEAYLV